MKIVKIILKTMAVIIVVLILAIITIPTLFRGKIESLAKKTINENVNAQVDFQNLSITILRTFPNVTVSLEDIVVSGIDSFAGDTLADIKSLSVVVDIWALIKGDFVVKSVAIDDPYIKAKVLADGSANWDIMKAEEMPKPETAEEETASDFKLSLKKLEIKNANILYDSNPDEFVAGIKNMNLNLSGELSADHDIISLAVNSESVSMYQQNSSILSNIALAINGKFDADLAGNVYTLQDNEITINKMVLAADGTIKMPDNGLDFDLTYGLKAPSLESLLGIIPPTIIAEVNDIDTKGDLSMNGTVKGLYGDNSMPVITLALKVNDGYVKYAGLSESINNINIDLDMILDKNKDANSLVTLSKFGFNVMNNPFNVAGKVLFPFTDPDINLNINGKIDFSSLRKSMPLVNTSLDGNLNADIAFSGLLSHIDKKQYEKIALSGNLMLNNFKMRLDGITPDINIDNASLSFKPTMCTLNAFDAKMGKSDLHLSGNLENMLSYVFKGSSLKGNLNLKSDLFDCNELLSNTSTADNEPQEQQASVSSGGVIILPSNIDFGINTNIKQLIYDKITMSNFAGNVSLKEGKLNINKITGNTSGGLINLTGSYAAQNTEKADVNMKLSLDNVAVDDVAKSFDMFGKLAPILKDAKGKASFMLDFKTVLDKDMNPDYKTLNAEGYFKTSGMEVLSNENLSKLAGLLKIDSIKSIKNVNLNFAIRNGMIKVNPFDVKLGNFDMKIGGEHGITNDLNYDADIDIPAGKIGTEVNNALSKLGLATSGNSKVKAGIKIKGTMKNPSFSLGLPKYSSAASSIIGSETGNIKETVKSTVDSLKSGAKDKIETVIDSAKNKAKDKITNAIKDLFKR